jgi:hypothetical protein
MFLKEVLQQEFERKGDYKKQSVLLFDSTCLSLSEKHFETISKFLFAVFHRNRVFLLEKRSFLKSEALIPLGIRFKGHGATLILFSENGNCEYRIDLEDLQGIRISSSRFVDRSHEDMEIQRSEMGC